MPIEMKQVGWTIAGWNLAVYVTIIALVFTVGGFDPAVALAG